MPDEIDLARDYQEARIDRRTLIRGLLAAGLSATAATAFAEALGPTAAGASPSSEPAGAVGNSPLSPGVALPIVTKVHPNAGPLAGGNKVVLVGSNFIGTSKVTFGTASAHIKTVSATKIVVIAPAGTGTVQVVVTTPKGKSPTSNATKYHYLHVPVISSVSPNTGPETGGTAVTITGTHLSHLKSVTFGGTAGTVTHHTSTQITVNSPAHAATSTAVVVDVQVTTLGGASKIKATDQFTYQATPPTPGCGTCGGSCGSCGGSCGSCGGSCGGCTGSCALPETTDSVRRARAGSSGPRRGPERVRNPKATPVGSLSRARSRGAGLRPTAVQLPRD